MKSIPSLFKGHIFLSLKETFARKMNLSAKKTSDLGSTLQKYTKLLDKLQEEADDMKKEMKGLKTLFIKASKVPLKEQFENAISTFKDSKEKWSKAAALVVQIENDFGDNPAAKPLLDHAHKLMKEFKELEKEKEEILSQLTKTHIPIQLTTHDTKFFRPLISYIVQDLKKAGGGADIKIKESKYIPGIVPGKAGQIRFARYIPLVNIPTIFGERKNTYLIVTVTYMAYGEEKGKIVPLMLTDKRGVEKPAISQYSIGIMNKFNDPISLSKILYKAPTLMDAKNILAYFAQKNNFAVFGQEIEGTVEERLEKVREKLYLLNDPDIKILKDKNKRNFITIKIPKEKVKTSINTDGSFPNTENFNTWDKKLFMDVKAILGIPAWPKGPGRLRIERVTEKGDFVYFLYRVLPVTDNFVTDDITHKKIDSMGVDSEFDSIEDSGRGGLTVEGLRELTKAWLKVGN